jgi:uncharacterized protein (TIGR00255 family)
MTGLGHHAVETASGRFEAEARSVNHRFLKVSAHLPPGLQSLEPVVEERTREHVERGHVSVGLRFTPSARAAAAAFRVDEAAMAAAAKRLKALARKHGLEGGVTLRDVLGAPGVVADARDEAMASQAEKAATKALDGALEALVAARAREGAHLAAECAAILDRIEVAVGALAARAPEVPRAYRDRLAARLASLLEGSGVAPDPAALAREVAAFADRSDVAEEIARLRTHVAHARELFAGGGAIGRRLDFLVQEMHREANTVGSKSQDAALTSTVIDLKADVERIREQAQNFE